MKTNYAEQVAWFEHSVRPFVMTTKSHKTRCWYATIKRPPKSFELMRGDSYYGQDNSNPDQEVYLTHTRKRPRVQDSPFLMTMEDDPMEQVQEISPKEGFSFEDDTTVVVENADEENIVIDEGISMDNLHFETMAVTEQACNRYSSPLSRSMSEETVYFDASTIWNSSDSESSSSIQAPSLTHESLIKKTLKYSFNLETIIPNQLEAISAAVDRKDVFLVLPSGPLRNLCYQAPVIVALELQQSIENRANITIIIVSTPDFLLDHRNLCCSNKLSIQKVSKRPHPVEGNRGNCSWITRDQLYQQLISDDHDSSPLLLYFTYDEFSKSKYVIQTLYKQNRIARFVIDESHCLSQWGTDFHFGYLRSIESLRLDYPNIPITVMTGIPNPRIHIDIMNSLQMQSTTCHLFKKSIFLP